MKICIFDTETTGINAQTDQIIELAIQFGIDDNKPKSKTMRIKPDVQITKEAQDVHGISMADLIDCPRFPDVAEQIRDDFSSAQVIMGYNVSFDLDFLQNELIRAKLKPLELKDILIVDPYVLWRKMEPRSLSDAYKRFAGKDHKTAHSALGDVQATAEIFAGMLEQFKIKDRSFENIHKICDLDVGSWIGPSFHIQWKNKEPFYCFGKLKNTAVYEINKLKDKSYVSWMISSNLPDHVKEITKKATETSKEDFLKWLSEKY